MTSVVELFDTIYTYIISISGIIAFGSLVIGGFLYLSSAGEPEQMSKAKKQILSAFFGLFILFSAFFLLKMINPELVKFDLPALTAIPETPLSSPSYTILVPNILDRVKKIADEAKSSIERIEANSQEIKDLTDKCNCEIAQSLCVCDGRTDKSICRPLKVYSENENQPCPDGSEIKVKQKNIIAWKEELFYYKNRATAEAKYLSLEIEKLNKEKSYYAELSASVDDSELISYYENKASELAKEIELNNSLAKELNSLAELIDKTGEPSMGLSMLPEKCLSNIGSICKPNCKGKCHNLLSGCEPEKPNKGNPCPIEDIEDQLRNIQDLQSPINSVADQILNRILEIINFKTIVI